MRASALVEKKHGETSARLVSGGIKPEDIAQVSRARLSPGGPPAQQVRHEGMHAW